MSVFKSFRYLYLYTPSLSLCFKSCLSPSHFPNLLLCPSSSDSALPQPQPTMLFQPSQTRVTASVPSTPEVCIYSCPFPLLLIASRDIHPRNPLLMHHHKPNHTPSRVINSLRTQWGHSTPGGVCKQCILGKGIHLNVGLGQSRFGGKRVFPVPKWHLVWIKYSQYPHEKSRALKRRTSYLRSSSRPYPTRPKAPHHPTLQLTLSLDQVLHLYVDPLSIPNLKVRPHHIINSIWALEQKSSAPAASPC